METIKEIWKDIPNFEGYYQVSNLGRVKSMRRWRDNGNGGYYQKERVMTNVDGGDGYFRVILYKNGKKKLKRIHQLVCEAFLGHIPCGMNQVIDHINGNKKDNCLENLRIVTQRENSSNRKFKYTSKYTGVSLCSWGKKWRSMIYINGRLKSLGSFNTELEAHQAYQNALNNLKQ